MYVHMYGKGSFIMYATLEGEGAQEFMTDCDRGIRRTGHCVVRVVKVIVLALVTHSRLAPRCAVTVGYSVGVGN